MPNKSNVDEECELIFGLPHFIDGLIKEYDRSSIDEKLNDKTVLFWKELIVKNRDERIQLKKNTSEIQKISIRETTYTPPCIKSGEASNIIKKEINTENNALTNHTQDNPLPLTTASLATATSVRNPESKESAAGFKRSNAVRRKKPTQRETTAESSQSPLFNSQLFSTQKKPFKSRLAESQLFTNPTITPKCAQLKQGGVKNKSF